MRADHTRLPATTESHDDTRDDAASRSAARGRPYSRVRPLSSDDAADDGNYGRLCCLFVVEGLREVLPRSCGNEISGTREIIVITGECHTKPVILKRC